MIPRSFKRRKRRKSNRQVANFFWCDLQVRHFELRHPFHSKEYTAPDSVGAERWAWSPAARSRVDMKNHLICHNFAIDWLIWALYVSEFLEDDGKNILQGKCSPESPFHRESPR